MKNIFYALAILIGIQSCGPANDKSVSIFEIDKAVESKVEEMISESKFGNQVQETFLIYDNILITDYYEDDSLVMSTKKNKQKMPFKSFFYARNDTVTIDGAYGLFGGFGFSIKFIDDKPIVYYMAAGDDFPTYSMTKDGGLEYRIEVPCTNTKLTLSSIPELKEEEIIYGMVEFESGEYYQSGASVDGKEIEDRKKIRVDMKIYFKSKFLDVENWK